MGGAAHSQLCSPMGGGAANTQPLLKSARFAKRGLLHPFHGYHPVFSDVLNDLPSPDTCRSPESLAKPPGVWFCVTQDAVGVDLNTPNPSGLE